MSLVEFKIKPGQGVKDNNYKFNCLNMKGIFTSGKFDTKTGSVETVGNRGSIGRNFYDVYFLPPSNCPLVDGVIGVVYFTSLSFNNK